MKSAARFSVLIVVATLFCFAPFALGLNTVNASLGDGGTFLLSNTSSNIFALTFSSALDPKGGHHHKRDGCDTRDGAWDGGCSAVPEGGTALVYLSLAGLSCLGAAIFWVRRQARPREVN
jgi:hypothetical protein